MKSQHQKPPTRPEFSPHPTTAPTEVIHDSKFIHVYFQIAHFQARKEFIMYAQITTSPAYTVHFSPSQSNTPLPATD